MKIKRIPENNLKDRFFHGKAIIVVGARQVGKTTLLGTISAKQNKRLFNCDNPTDRELLENRDLEFLKGLVEDVDLILIDEAQKVSTIGQTLKLLVDHYGKKKQIIATGSSSINLLDNTSEPLTGRKYVYYLYPLFAKEIYKSKVD
ncbi:MAG: AAA family ATPase, partial [Candidatus Nanoarchaeia archaeon]